MTPTTHNSNGDSTKTMHSIQTTPLPSVIKGSNDWRKYRPLSLPNGVICLLVNDKESKTTACSVSVGAGASADPRELSGLAHFTEHMCFLGSDAYPKENEFKQYLSAHGGRSNASTSMSCTKYKFDVISEHAEKAIDIFSNFFISPSFTKSGTSREVNAVDSENSKNESDDGRRRLQILKALACPLHHYSKFSTGNAKTLPAVEGDRAEFVREAVLAFHKVHYRPDNMCVVAVGPQDLDQLEEWIVPRFAKVVDRLSNKSREEMSEAEKLVERYAKDMPDDSFGSATPPHNPAFKPEIQGKWPVLLTTRPLKSLRKLFLYFPLPSTRDLGDRSPYSLLSHLLGHEGPGSCFSVLQNAGLVNGLSAGPRLAEIDQSLFQISIALTEKGEEYWEHVIKIIFEYCRMLHEQGKSANDGDEQATETFKRIWDEIRTLRALRFHQNPPNPAFSFAPNVANSVRLYGTEKCLSAGSLLNETRDSLPLDELLAFLEKINPENCFVERCSKSAWKDAKQKSIRGEEKNGSVFGFQTEKWYNIEYHLAPIHESSVLDLWKGNIQGDESAIVENEKLHLPNTNRFIPRDLSLCSDLPEEAKEGPRISKDMEPPNLIIDNDFGRLWHRLDDRYCLPKSSVSFLIRNPFVQNVFDETKNEWSYDTSAAMHSVILLSIFNDALAQETYDAGLAGLHWRLSKTSSGLILNFSGYSEHLASFAMHIVSLFFKHSEECFLADGSNEKYLQTNKDKYLRNLKSYMESKRADIYAQYYTDLLLSSCGKGIAHTISVTEAITLESVVKHHEKLISADVKIDCLYAGNVSSRDAKQFFHNAQEIIAKVRTEHSQRWTPGPFGRKLKEGEEIHLHFQSQNKEEQNGAVLMTFQSNIPGYKGLGLSKPNSLVQTAAIRTICHMLREPLFNQLRTKEQLGYIVSSYYDNSMSSNHNQIDFSGDNVTNEGSTPIDSIVLKVLSKKVPPTVVTKRIDEFLGTFRDKLRDLPEEELKNHTSSLQKKMLKPKQKLGDEVRTQLSKITTYAPEVLRKELGPSGMPWNSTEELANTVRDLKSNDLLNAWDSVVAGKKRARIITHVYGSTFPLSKDSPGDFEVRNSKAVSNIKCIKGIECKRLTFSQYSCQNIERQRNPLLQKIVEKRFGVALAVLGAGLVFGINVWARKGSVKESSSFKK